MAKRRAADKAKAVGMLAPIKGGTGKPDGKDLIQLAAERLAEARFTDMMAAAGVGHDRMAVEVLYWLPRDFIDLYQELYTRALAGTDSGTGARGKAAEQTGVLGKAKGKTKQGKRYKKYWVIQDESILQMKERIDKRLRQMTRDIREELGELEFFRARGEIDKPKTNFRIMPRCGECGIMTSAQWDYCPRCGCPQHAAPVKVKGAKPAGKA